MKNDYSILIGGEAGQGSKKAALIMGEVFNKLGYRVFIYNDYQSLVRGGHNFSQIRISQEEVLTHRNPVNFLMALDKNTIEKHKDKLEENSIIFYNADRFETEGIGISLKEIENTKPIMSGIALVSAFIKFMGVNFEVLEKVIKENLKKKTELNLKVARTVFEKNESKEKIEKLNNKPLSLMNGNETLSLGAVKAGLDFYFAYPMTPATGILNYLADNKEEFKIRVAQFENEVGVVNTAVGAAYSGARTMLGTSGGGFALMTEGLSLAVQSEIPLLMVESQRTGPASGVPTYTEQADLSFVLSAGHGDITKFVVAPGDTKEACYWSGKLLNLSWKYQTPSVLLIDKEISESIFSFDKEILNEISEEKPKLWEGEDQYLRYKDEKDGISPLAFPGQKATVKSNSYEHDEFGLTTEDKEKVKKMKDKRERKFEKMKEEINNLKAVKIYGKGEKAIIAWGSTKGAAKEAAAKLGFKLIQPVVLEPFPAEQMRKALKEVEEKILVEVNQKAQLGKLLNQYGIEVDKKILKYNGRPFTPGEIIKKIE